MELEVLDAEEMCIRDRVIERQEHQQEREQAFLAQNRDCFAIYQVSRDAVSYTHLQSSAGGTGQASGGQCGRLSLLELVRL